MRRLTQCVTLLTSEGYLIKRNIYPCELKLGSNTELQLMLHMSVTGVTKLHICSMYWQLVAVDNG